MEPPALLPRRCRGCQATQQVAWSSQTVAELELAPVPRLMPASRVENPAQEAVAGGFPRG